jgi:sugar O-acyltransferase (sialic acid O-acetyltransferase NeuD family)
MRLLLVGAGGHARVVADTAGCCGHEIVAYAAPEQSVWLDGPRVADSDAKPEDYDGFLLGIGGVIGEALVARWQIYAGYLDRGFTAVSLIHPRAVVSEVATIAPGAMVLPGAMLNAGAQIGEAAIVNTGAIVEHDARIGSGAHVAPGAIVLGGAQVGNSAMVGAGSVVLPGTEVVAEALVGALTRHGAAKDTIQRKETGS